MSWPTAALGDIAPAKPIKLKGHNASDKIWQVTLDHIESNTGHLLEKTIKPISEAGSSTYAFDQRHVLYSKLRPYLNKVLLPQEIGLGTTELVPMLPKPDQLDRVYLAYYLKSSAFVNWVSSQTAGAKMPRVSMKVFWEHEIPLPPLAEQKRIAAILDKADSLRRKRQQAIQLADQFLRAVFLDMFGDPVTNPKGWPLFPVNKLGNVITGSTPPSSKDGMFGTDIPFVTPGDLNSNLNQVVRWLSQEGAKHSRTCRQGSLMACCIGATIGKVAISNRLSAFNQQINVIEWNKSVNDIYGYFLFKMNPAFITEKSIKTTLPILKKSLFEEIILSIPPIEKQNAFSEKVLATWKFQNTNTKALSYPLFESLSQKAFAGEL